MLTLNVLLLLSLTYALPPYFNSFPGIDFKKGYNDLLDKIEDDISDFLDSQKKKSGPAHCDGGHYYNDNTKQCEQCQPGYYSAGGYNVSCLPCPIGHFNDIPGAVQCQLCLAGHYSYFIGAEGCIPCKKGTYKSSSGPGNCTECPNKRTYTTMWTGATSSGDCVGPLAQIKDKVTGIVTHVHDNTRITWNHNIELFATSGDWVFRNPAAPNYFYQTVKLVQGMSSTSIWNLPTGWTILEPVMVNKFCYIDVEGHGKVFSGPHDRDHLGRKCKAPCRNPDNTPTGPYCEVKEITTGKYVNSTCGIPKCIWDVECSANNGEGYRGNVSTATTDTYFGGLNFECQKWDSNFPHPHIFHPTKENEKKYGIVGNNNNCRNPAPEAHTEPWCYTTSIWARAMSCNIKRCDESFDYFRKDDD